MIKQVRMFHPAADGRRAFSGVWPDPLKTEPRKWQTWQCNLSTNLENTMSTTHTPGPWEIYRPDGRPRNLYGYDIREAGSKLFVATAASSCSYRAEPECKANADLIAAAPDLLAALERALGYLADLNGCDWISGDGPGERDMRQRAKALQSVACNVIAKARGE